MTKNNKCPVDCYLYEKSPNPTDGEYTAICKLNINTRKCWVYLKKLPGTRTNDPILIYHALLGLRSRRTSFLISVTAILISLASLILSIRDNKNKSSSSPVIYLLDSTDSLNIGKYINQNETTKNTQAINNR